jgi:hypothetical protein
MSSISVKISSDGNVQVKQKYSVGKSILKGLAAAGITIAGVGVMAGGSYLSDPGTAGQVFKDIPIAIPIGAVAFQFLGTAFMNFAKQKLLKQKTEETQ